MKKNTFMILALVSGMMIASCGQKEATQETQDAATQTPAETEQAAPVNTTHAYICPMNCENSARMEPGKCVVCGMDLVANPNYVADAGAPAGDSAAAAHDHDHDHDHDHEGHNH